MSIGLWRKPTSRLRDSERRLRPRADRATPKHADAALLKEPAFGVEEAIKRLAALPTQERALALTKLSLDTPIPPRF